MSGLLQERKADRLKLAVVGHEEQVLQDVGERCLILGVLYEVPDPCEEARRVVEVGVEVGDYVFQHVLVRIQLSVKDVQLVFQLLIVLFLCGFRADHLQHLLEAQSEQLFSEIDSLVQSLHGVHQRVDQFEHCCACWDELFQFKHFQERLEPALERLLVLLLAGLEGSEEEVPALDRVGGHGLEEEVDGEEVEHGRSGL